MTRLSHLLFCPLVCIPSLSPAQTTLTIHPSSDCAIGYHDNYDTENNNYNWSPHAAAVAQPGTNGGVNLGRDLMAFDLTSIPEGATVLAAFMSLTAIGPFGGGPVGEAGHLGQNECTLRRITEQWSANTVTWNNRPDVTAVNEAILPASTYAEQNYLHVDVTALVQDMVDDPANSHGMQFALVDETPTRGMAFHSTEGPDPDRWPVLTVIHGECGAIGMGTAPAPVAPVLRLVPSITRAGDPVRITADQDLPTGSSVHLLNSLGQETATFPINGRSLLFTVPSIAAGAYTVTLRSGLSMRGTVGTLVVR